jgi:hypothetical protein
MSPDDSLTLGGGTSGQSARNGPQFTYVCTKQQQAAINATWKRDRQAARPVDDDVTTTKWSFRRERKSPTLSATDAEPSSGLRFTAKFVGWNTARGEAYNTARGKPLGLDWVDTGENADEEEICIGDNFRPCVNWEDPLDSFRPYLAAMRQVIETSCVEQKEAIAAFVQARKDGAPSQKEQSDMDNVSTFYRDGLHQWDLLRRSMESWARKTENALSAIGIPDGDPIEADLISAWAYHHRALIRSSLLALQKEHAQHWFTFWQRTDVMNATLRCATHRPLEVQVVNHRDGVLAALEQYAVEADDMVEEANHDLCEVIRDMRMVTEDTPSTAVRSQLENIINTFKESLENQQLDVAVHESSAPGGRTPAGQVIAGDQMELASGLYRLLAGKDGFKLLDYGYRLTNSAWTAFDHTLRCSRSQGGCRNGSG